MTVFITEPGGAGKQWCRLVATNERELDEMALLIHAGYKIPGRRYTYYNVPSNCLDAALKYGARPISEERLEAMTPKIVL